MENVDWFFLKAADQSYLIKIVRIMHNKIICSQTEIAHSFVNRSHPEQHTGTN